MRIIWTRLALQDVENVYELIALHSPKVANEIVKRIENGIDNLKLYPNVGKKGRLKDTRELAIPSTPFLLPYRIKETHMEILALLHGRRKWL